MCPSCRYGHSWKVFYGHKNPNAQFSPMRRDDDVQQNPAVFLNRRPIFERFPVHLCWWVVFHQTIKHWLGSMRKLKQGNVMDTLSGDRFKLKALRIRPSLQNSVMGGYSEGVCQHTISLKCRFCPSPCVLSLFSPTRLQRNVSHKVCFLIFKRHPKYIARISQQSLT